MDNATHSLFGLLIAESTIVLCERRGLACPAAVRSALRWVSVLANNLNDLDATYAQRLGGKLGYVLHHRGHTHTLLVAPVLGLALFGLWMGVAALRKKPFPAQHRVSLLALCCLGPLVHIGLDALNNYGVHPFWPVAPHWIYGDTLFIIEPWLWVLLVPALVFNLTSRVAQGSLVSILVLGLGLSWGLEMVPPVVALALTVGAVVALWGFSRARFAQRVSLAWGLVGVVLAAFTLGGRSAEARVRHALADTGSGGALLDVVVTPAPGNPLCYGVLTVQLDAERYVASSGWLSLWPAALSATDCRIQPTGATLGLRRSPLGKSAEPNGTGVRVAGTRVAGREGLHWEGYWSGSSDELRRLWQDNCHVQAWMRFARVPFWQPAAEARWLLGDLRFDRDPGLDFDEFHVEGAPSACPSYVPSWLEPRSDVLSAPGFEPRR